MPYACCVPGCKSNYNYKSGENIRVFSFPKDSERRSTWLKKINRGNFEPTKSSRVCIRHFSETFIIREDKATREDGTVITAPRKNFALTKDAYPSIFENQPKYLSHEPPAKRKCPQDRLAEAQQRNESEYKKWLQQDSIQSFEAFKKVYKEKLTSKWTTIDSESDYILFCYISHSDSPSLVVSFKIFPDLKVKAWFKSLAIPACRLNWLLGEELKCNRWSKFECLLSHFASYKNSQISSSNAKEHVDCAIAMIEEAVQIEVSSAEDDISNEIPQHTSEDKDQKVDKLNFLKEQLSLIYGKKCRYSPEMLIWSCNLYFSGTSFYSKLRRSARLTLPHPEYIKKLSLNFGASESGIKNSHIKYLEEKNANLNEKEKCVNVLLDEI